MTDGVADKTGRLQPGKSHVYNVLCVFVACLLYTSDAADEL